MKFNKFTEKEQEIRFYLSANAFGSFLGMELHLSVVNPVPGMTANTIGGRGIERILASISKKDKYQTNHKICMSVHLLMDGRSDDRGHIS